MTNIFRDKFWRLVAGAFILGLYLLSYAIITTNKDISIVPRVEAKPHVVWRLSPVMTTPEEVIDFINVQGLHVFHIMTDVHENGWHFHVIYEKD